MGSFGSKFTVYLQTFLRKGEQRERLGTLSFTKHLFSAWLHLALNFLSHVGLTDT